MRFLLVVVLLLGAAGQASTQSPGTQEGVTVHGDWVIEVRNADGTLAQRHAFRNALVGAPLLAKILARQVVPGAWSVKLVGDACGTRGDYCEIHENAGLTVALSPAGNTVVLRGTATSDYFLASFFDRVTTRLSACAANTTPSSTCTDVSGTNFSDLILATPIPITNGQMATVTVTFSFS